jgi:hypothetical protein
MAKVYTYGKDLVMEVEENIDEYIFFDFLVAYKTLIKQMKKVDDGFNTTPHSMLMDYLFYKLEDERQEHHKSKLGV